MKVYCYLGAGEVAIPSDRLKEMELEEVLSIFRRMCLDSDFMGVELDSTKTFQFLPERDGRFRVELLDTSTHSFEFCSLSSTELETLIKAAFAGQDLKSELAPANVKWSLDHF